MVTLLQGTLGEDFFLKQFQALQEALNTRSAEQAALFAAVQLQQERYARQEEMLQAITEQLRSGDPCVFPSCGSPAMETPKPSAGDTDFRVRDVEPTIQECNDAGAMRDKVHTQTAEMSLEMIGKWVDLNGSFFNGHVINIYGDQTWTPEYPGLQGQHTATYSLEPISEIRVKLIETRLDMSEHVYLAEFNHDSGTIDITMPTNSSLHWSLVKKQDKTAASLRLASRLDRDASHVSIADIKFYSTTIQKYYFSAHRFSQKILKATEFDLLIGVVIVINSISIGVQLHYSLGPPGKSGMPAEVGGPVVFTILENIALTIYVLEIIANLFAEGWKKCFTDTWFIFDFGLVITGAISQWVVEPIMNQSVSTSDQNQLQQLLVLRLLRLLRLMRAVRGMRRFKTPWRLVTGLISSTSTMVSTLGLLVLILYLFACIGIEVITNDEALWIGERELMEERYSSLTEMICSLAQFVTLDSPTALYLPLVRLKPGLILFFVPMFMIVSIVLMNLVTAVIVESALDSASHDKEIAKMNARHHMSKLRPIVTEFYRKVDKHQRGIIQIEDLTDFSLDELPEEIRASIKVETMQDLFWILDVSVSGHVSELEFVEGMVNIALDYTGKASVETVLLLNVLRIVKANSRAITKAIPRVAHPGIKAIKSSQASPSSHTSPRSFRRTAAL